MYTFLSELIRNGNTHISTTVKAIEYVVLKLYHAFFFFLDLSITYPINMLKKLSSDTPANTGMRMAYSCERKYLCTK